ncbi:MAG: glycine cleavage system aminomethyltransferase GcvT [Anaerolineae bacterium]|nr:glycine cleavage system aminomethyltransferase GcvT [Anaerolineae bacterium]
MALKDFLFRGSLADLDPAVAQLVEYEAERQARRLILIPSESSIPAAVREATGSILTNLYAEGYPAEDTRHRSVSDILDYEWSLANYRRYADLRYYKGVEYADILEALARRRGAALFATAETPADQLYVNVQPLSGSPANTAIYEALLNHGETVMGLDLKHGGHLTHGSPVNRSGKTFNIVSYAVDPETDVLNYDTIMELAREHKPRMIIAGFTSYPWAADWARFREIADACGAYLMADIAHVAGMVAAGAYPSPVGIADVVVFTTHKTLAGPRGAVIITHRKDLYKHIDKAVFPGEQGGPHMNAIAGIATAFQIATTEPFKKLQFQTVANAKRLAEQLAAHGFRIPHGGTNTHLLLLDCKSVTGPDGTPLSGDMAARILDLAGIVVNRNTIPGDESAARPTGIRLGTPWVTQRGFKEPEIDALAKAMADLLHACTPFSYLRQNGRAEWRAKADFDALQSVKLRVRDLADAAGLDIAVQRAGYPHHYYIEDVEEHWATLEIVGPNAAEFLNLALTSRVFELKDGQSQPTWVLLPEGEPLSRGILVRRPERDRNGYPVYHLHVEHHIERIAAWLRDLSDGYINFDPVDVHAKLPGPVIVRALRSKPDLAATGVDIKTDWTKDATGFSPGKVYYIGVHSDADPTPDPEPKPAFAWEPPAESESGRLLKTSLHALHQELGAKLVPFAGWEMPVWYAGVSEEHAAVRTGAGLFDVAHMGVFEVSGAGAEVFLNSVTTNDISNLEVGMAHYSYLLDLEGIPIDDIFVYRLGRETFMLVVNAANNDKDWAWLDGVRKGRYAVTASRPGSLLPGHSTVSLRNLRAPAVGDEMRVDLALQGPKSKDLLLSLPGEQAEKSKIARLPWAGVARAKLGGYDLVVARTGYTGERVAYELFIHPDAAPHLFKDLVEYGATPCGLASRDSTRTEAGLPLYGHELAGPLNLGPADAGFGFYVKVWKPFFVGKSAYAKHEMVRDSEVVRFRMNDKGVRMPALGDPVVDKRGRVIGTVTSCALDSEGFLLGQAYIKLTHAAEGTPIGVFQTGGKATLQKAKEPLEVGGRVQVPSPATVLSRFPKKGK